MKNEVEIKKMVKEKYAEIVLQEKQKKASSCCGENCCSDGAEFSIIKDEYKNLPGYVPEADYALGCGLPTQFAKITAGNTVVDLGSGAGNDCFVARALVGESGHVIGIDMTEAMIEKAKANALKLGLKNVEFILGEIENIPLKENIADVVISNCVLNLVPNKRKAFAEIFRILKSGGHFSISDIVLQGEFSEKLQQEASLYAGCISGAIQKDEYLRIIKEAGFVAIHVQREIKVDIPQEVLAKDLTPEILEEYKRSNVGIFSITVYAEKPLALKFRQANESDYTALKSLLESQNLSTETVGTSQTDFYVAEDRHGIVGVAGFEYYGKDALLRSIAVPSSLQRKHIGSILVDYMIELARQKNIQRIFLLTETAAEFFARKGFEKIEKVHIGNSTIFQSSQFLGQSCCKKATCMVLELAS